MTGKSFHLHDQADRQRLVNFINSLPARRAYTVEVKRYMAPGSLPQKAYLHILIRILAEHVGVTEKEMKRDLKHHLWPHKEHVHLVTGEVETVPKDTAELNSTEINRVIDQIHELAINHFDVRLPPPKPKYDVSQETPNRRIEHEVQSAA